MQKGVPPTLIRDVNRLHPKMREATEEFLRRCKAAGVNIFITQTLRTVEAQQEYYSWGRTKTNPFQGHRMVTVTNCDGIHNKSRHQSGLAIDIACSPPAKLYDPEILRKAGEIAEKMGLTWGGRWKSYPDAPHIEMNPAKVASFKIKKEDEEVVTKEKIKINGKDVVVEVIKKNNQNFIRLADLRDQGLDVKFDNVAKKVEINFHK